MMAARQNVLGTILDRLEPTFSLTGSVVSLDFADADVAAAFFEALHGNVFPMTDSAAQIIDAKGGPAAVAAAVGRSAGAVRVWKHRNAFPREAWPEIIGAYPDITLDRLKAMELPAAPPDSSSVPEPQPPARPQAEAEGRVMGWLLRFIARWLDTRIDARIAHADLERTDRPRDFFRRSTASVLAEHDALARHLKDAFRTIGAKPGRGA